MITLLTSLFLSTSEAATNSLGFAAGGTYGAGLSYSYDTEEWGIQITTLPIWDEEEGGRIFGGINLKKNFHENGKVGLYGSVGVGAGIWKDIDEDCRWVEDLENPENGENICTEVIDEGWGVITGPGVGMQYMFWDNMVLRFELPFGIRTSSEGFGITPIPNAALLYRW